MARLSLIVTLILMLQLSSAVVIRNKCKKNGNLTSSGMTVAPSMTPNMGTMAATTTTEPTTTQPAATTPSEKSCFPADAQVLLESGQQILIHDLKIGDRIHVGIGRYSDVFMFTHKLSDAMEEFIQLETVSGDKLTLSAGHYLYANDALVAADVAKVGDVVELGSGSKVLVSAKSRVLKKGLFNPQTVSGDIVVNNIRASCYTTAVEPTIAHVALAPLRAAYEALGWATRVAEDGSSLANALPSGMGLVQ